MSKAQDLLQKRNNRGESLEFRTFEEIENSGTMESYFEKILSDTDVENALDEYKGNYDTIRDEFLERTKIQGADLGFLFVATALHCVRIYVINRITEIEKANTHGGKEDAIHKFQDRVLNKFGGDASPVSEPMYASLEAIITTRGVPYDAQAPFEEEVKKLHLFRGANHRFSTLGHDPLLGLIFGTANILTNTITMQNFKTYPVVYDSMMKNPKVGLGKPGMTFEMLDKAVKRFDDDKESVVAATIKQLLHLATDMYTPCGIQLPGAGLILSNSNVESLTEYISTGDLIKIGASAGLASWINMIVSAVHGCKLLFKDNGEEFNKDLYQARTRKIIMYSNVIASSSNIIATAFSGDIKKMDVGGLLITISRVFNDMNFLTKLEYEYINSGVSKIYDKKLKEVEVYY